MKKAILSTAVAVMMSTTAVFATDLTLDGDVDSTIAAGFAAQDSKDGVTAFDLGSTTSTFTSIGAGGTFAAMAKEVYVKTNDPQGVSMTITGTNDGALVDSVSSETIAVAYTYGDETITLATPFSLTATKDTGVTALEALNITPAAAAADQAPGTYNVTLGITIAAQ